MTDTPDKQILLELTADIVASYVANNSASGAELPDLMRTIYGTLEDLASDKSKEAAEPLVPIVAIEDSITPDYLICLEDGKSYKSLKRHLRTQYNLTPEAYREKWGLPHDYPMVAPNYAKARSALAKEMGLGRKGAS